MTTKIFNISQVWRLYHLPGHPVPVLSNLIAKKVFPDVQEQPPAFQFVPNAFCPAFGYC